MPKKKPEDLPITTLSDIPLPHINPDIVPPPSLTVNDLVKISLPKSLNEYYAPFIKDIPDCIIFLERFSEEDKTIRKLVQAYKELGPTNQPNLDDLAEKAGLTTGEFRRLMNSTLDLLSDEEAIMILRHSKSHIVRKSVEVALDDNNINSFQERKALLEYYGYRLIPKGSGVSVNIQNTSNNNNNTLALQQTNNVVNGLPTFSDRMLESEKAVADRLKEMIESDPLQEEKPMKQLPPSSAIPIDMNSNDEEEETIAVLLKKEPTLQNV